MVTRILTGVSPMSAEPERSDNGWTIDTLHTHIDRQVLDLKAKLDERQRAQETAVALRFDAVESRANERVHRIEQAAALAFNAAEKAVDLRTNALDREFKEHLAQYRHETELVLAANDKAIAKAEESTERRFHAHNAFREQLSAQATTFLPREVADASFNDLQRRLNALTTRMDTSAGRSSGYSALYGWGIAGMGLILTTIIVATSVLARVGA